MPSSFWYFPVRKNSDVRHYINVPRILTTTPYPLHAWRGFTELFESSEFHKRFMPKTRIFSELGNINIITHFSQFIKKTYWCQSSYITKVSSQLPLPLQAWRGFTKFFKNTEFITRFVPRTRIFHELGNIKSLKWRFASLRSAYLHVLY